MAYKFYKDGLNWVSQIESSVSTIQPGGKYKLVITNSNLVSILGINADIVPLLKQILVTDIEKDSVGGLYGDIGEFILATQEFFGGSSATTTIVNGEGEAFDAYNPFQVRHDTIYMNDVDWENSDFTGWIGNPMDIFGNVNNGGIHNISTDNPKVFILRFKRTHKMRDFGVGASTGSFSNIKVTILGSSDAERGVLDASEDPGNMTSLVYSEEEFVFNALRVEFFTEDRIDVTNIFLNYSHSTRKQDYIHKFGINPEIDIGGSESIWSLGDQYIFTTTPQPYYISSSNAGDGLEIEGELILINDEGRYERFIYNITLQGQTKLLIPTPNGWNVVASNRAFNNSVIPLSGDVYVYEDTTLTGGVPDNLSNVRSIITQGREQTEQAVYTVPEYLEDGRKVIFAEFYRWYASAIRNRTTTGIIDLRIAPKSKVARVQGTRGLSNQYISGQNFGENTPLIVQPASDIYLQASEISVNNVSVEGDFVIKLVVL